MRTDVIGHRVGRSQPCGLTEPGLAVLGSTATVTFDQTLHRSQTRTGIQGVKIDIRIQQASKAPFGVCWLYVGAKSGCFGGGAAVKKRLQSE